MLKSLRAQMPDNTWNSILGAGFRGGEDVTQVFKYNALPMGREGMGAVYLCCSRINHSCDPNVKFVWNEITTREELFACRDIGAGEELKSNYFPVFVSKTTRNGICRDVFEFECNCDVCRFNDPAEDGFRMELEQALLEMTDAESRGDWCAFYDAASKRLRLLDSREFSYESPATLHALVNVCGEISGKHEEGRVLASRLVMDCSKSYGVDHPFTIKCMQLANDYSKL